MTSLNPLPIPPTGGVQDRPALSFMDRCTIADREIGNVIEKIAAVRDLLKREQNEVGQELLADTLTILSDTLHSLRGRQTIMRNLHPLLQKKLAEIQ